MSELCCNLDYEAEYNRLLCELEKAKCELEHWKEVSVRTERENISLRAKVEMVELIFGGGNR